MTPTDDQRAWAAGFFDGEGCFYSGKGGRSVVTISQVDREVLDRFHAIVQCGNVYGPQFAKKNQNQKPFYAWRCSSRADFDHVVYLLWPWLGTVKRKDAERVAALAGPGGNAQSRKTHCPQGHPYDETNTRWVRASRHATELTGRQCRACHRVRNAEQWRRIKSQRKSA